MKEKTNYFYCHNMQRYHNLNHFVNKFDNNIYFYLHCDAKRNFLPHKIIISRRHSFGNRARARVLPQIACDIWT